MNSPASQMTTDERREYIAKLRQERQEREIGRMSSSLTTQGPLSPSSFGSLNSLSNTPRSSTPFSPPPSRFNAAGPRTEPPSATQPFPLTYTNSTISSPSATPLPSTSNTSPLSTPSETPRVPNTPNPNPNNNNNNNNDNHNNNNTPNFTSNFTTQNLEPLSPPRIPSSSLLSSPTRTAKIAPPNIFTTSQLSTNPRATQDFVNNKNTTTTNDSPSVFSRSTKAPGSIASINNSQKSYSLWAEEKLRWWEQESQKMQQFLQQLDDEWAKHREHTRRELEDEIQALRHESLVKAGLAQNSLSITSPFTETPSSPTKTSRREDNFGSSSFPSATRASSMFAPR